MFDSYEIQPGDTIKGISEKFSISIDDLFSANKWSYMDLEPGSVIKVPYSRSNSFDYYIVKDGDTLYKVGKEHDISPDDLALLNGLELNEYIYPNQKLLVPKEGVRVYITKEGDTINSISSRVHSKPEELIYINEDLIVVPDQMIVYKEK